MNILVTGAAGFIGYHLCERLISTGHTVIGLDNINAYYDVNLKYSRLENLGINRKAIAYNKIIPSTIHGDRMQFVQLNLEDKSTLEAIFESQHIDIACNLAAQAGVRYSIEKPTAYVDSNVVGFLNILEACRHYKVTKLVYASSSSVYGANEKVPFSVSDNVDHPISLYAATKKSNELMAHTYSHLFGIETIGLRFFTVYGPWGRPDMAMFLFTDAILNHKPIQVFNNGDLSRDFTFIDDIINGLAATITTNSRHPKKYALYNIGNSKPVRLVDFITEIEKITGIQADKVYLPMQPGDVPQTWADVTDLQRDFDYQPMTDIPTGIRKFVDWYRGYYGGS